MAGDLRYVCLPRTPQATIQQIFTVHSLPELLITDKGPASEFESFFQFRGIHHTRTAPYHPCLNGEAERLVEPFKLAINKADPKNERQLLSISLLNTEQFLIPKQIVLLQSY